MDKVIINKKEVNFEELFLDYLNFLEGIKTHCKAMHWGINNVVEVTSKQSAHVYLDELLDIISDYQDMVAETTQGIFGNYITINNIKGKEVPETLATTPIYLCEWILTNVYSLYNKLNLVGLIGIKSETETFIQNLQKYKHLFNLC